jgi:hypothetical protein
MYKSITNPITGKQYSTNSKLGKEIVNNYANLLGGDNKEQISNSLTKSSHRKRKKEGHLNGNPNKQSKSNLVGGNKSNLVLVTIVSLNEPHNESKIEIHNLGDQSLTDLRNYYIDKIKEDYSPEVLIVQENTDFNLNGVHISNEEDAGKYITIDPKNLDILLDQADMLITESISTYDYAYAFNQFSEGVVNDTFKPYFTVTIAEH